jgi:hypothetical protein
VSSGRLSFWNLGNGLYKSNWQDNLNIALTKEEGEFIKNRINETCKGSLLNFILNDLKDKKDIRIEISKCSAFKRLKKYKNLFPPELQTAYELALNFSNFNEKIINIFYNDIISENQTWDINELKTVAGNTDINKIYSTLKLANNSGYDLKDFLDNIKSAILDEDTSKVKALISKRESFLKVSRAKTNHPDEYRRDDDYKYGVGELDYRFKRNARTILRDIIESESA